MGLDIATNIMAQDASNALSINESNMTNSLDKLSSGYRINKAADDASGLVISQHLQSQIGGFQQAQANTQNAINVVQTANGALNEVDTILQRINTLAVEAANTTATDPTALTAAQQEVGQSLDSLDDIANTTVYGNQQLLTTSGASGIVTFNFQIGADSTSYSQVSFTFNSLSVSGLGLTSIQTGGSYAIGTTGALVQIASAISTVSALQGTLGAYQSELQDVSDNEGVMVQNLQASNAQIADTNMASQMVNFTQDQVLVQAGVSMLAQANQIPQMVLKLLG